MCVICVCVHIYIDRVHLLKRQRFSFIRQIPDSNLGVTTIIVTDSDFPQPLQTNCGMVS
jgi:hypothetical protein